MVCRGRGDRCPGTHPRQDRPRRSAARPEKRTDVAIRAFAASGLADDGWRLKVAGHGSLLVELERLTEELGISARVDFLGPRRDVAELMSRSAILLAPCPIEGLGLVVLEAMAAQLPVVASAGGHLETLPARSRLLL